MVDVGDVTKLMAIFGKDTEALSPDEVGAAPTEVSRMLRFAVHALSLTCIIFDVGCVGCIGVAQAENFKKLIGSAELSVGEFVEKLVKL